VSVDWRSAPRRFRNAIRRMRMDGGGKDVAEAWWRKRGGEEWVATYWNDDHSPRRDHIIAAIRTSFGAPSSVLDVGCNAAPNLRRVAAEFPGCRLAGFDINAEAISVAARRFSELGIPVDLSVGSFYDILPAIATGSFDLVLSSFALAYVPQVNLPDVLQSLVRIAQRGLVLAEPTAFGGKRSEGVLSVPWHDWRHDYPGVLAGIGVPANRVTVFDVPVAGERDSGLVVADLRASGRPPVEGLLQTVDEPDARGPA
jgi:SAM-dependent methyltransferase